MEDQSSGSSSDDEETPIREKLSHMSLEELQQLREKLGTKVFDEAMFGLLDTQEPSVSDSGAQSSKRRINDSATQVHEGRRKRKNKPLEISSKTRPRKTLPSVEPIAMKPQALDPRFDTLCGEFDKKSFQEDYGFLDTIRSNELKQLRVELTNEEDEDRKEKISFLIQRIENQDREKDRLKKKERQEIIRRNTMIKTLKKGKKPVYHNKSELRMINLIDQYKELKSTNGLQKHILKQRKKNATKGRKLLEQDGQR